MLKSMFMQDFIVFAKSTLVITFVWLFDIDILLQVNLITNDFKSFLENSRELINLIVSFLILVITVIKLIRVYKNNKE